MIRPQIFRQILVVTGLAFCCVSDGFIFGQMSGMIDALHTNEGPIQLSDDDVSWIASVINLICLCGFCIMTTITEMLGRRKTIAILSSPIVLCWVMVYFAQDKTVLLISRVIVGISFGGVVMLTYICTGEYVSPNLRPLCLNMISSFGTNAGTMLGHVLSTVMDWRNVALVGIVPSALSVILPLFWVESPSWLASKGRLKECEIAFNLLHLPNESSNNELNSLLANQINAKYKKDSRHFNSLISLIRRFVAATKTKQFWKILVLSLIILSYRTVAGRVFFSTFAITILQDITSTSNILVYTLFVDGFMMIGTTFACVLINRCNLRSLILKSGTLANVVQVLLAISLLIWGDRDDYVVWIKVFLMAMYLIIVNAGPYVVIETLLSELFPLEIKAIFMLITGIFSSVIQFLSIKFAPMMFQTIGYHGVFFINSIITFICLTYIYFFLPETKGRTLQEIEYYFKYNTFEIKKDDLGKKDEELINIIKKSNDIERPE